MCTPKPNPPSPPDTPRQTRSWRRTVADALAFAQSAVELDSKNTDPMGALVAYTESVRHLRRILARLERHGAHAEASRLAAIVRSPIFFPLIRVEPFFPFRVHRPRDTPNVCACCVDCAVPPPPYDCSSSESSHRSSSLLPPHDRPRNYLPHLRMTNVILSRRVGRRRLWPCQLDSQCEKGRWGRRSAAGAEVFPENKLDCCLIPSSQSDHVTSHVFLQLSS
jgi:hypothetical protein